MKRKGYSLKSMPRRAAQAAAASSCVIAAGALAFASVGMPVIGPKFRSLLLIPSAGCAASALYMANEAVTPEDIG